MKTDSGPVMAEETSTAQRFKRPAPEQWNEVEEKRRRGLGSGYDFYTAVELLLKAADYSESDSDSPVQDTSCESIDSSCAEDLRNGENMSPLGASGSSAESYMSESSMSVIVDDNTVTGGAQVRGQQWNSSPEQSPNPESGEQPASPAASNPSSPPSPSTETDAEKMSEADDLNQVTCYCDKPYAGRAMIECSKCLRWIHLSCAKIRKNNIPEVFWCQKCKDKEYTIRKSKRTPVAKVKRD